MGKTHITLDDKLIAECAEVTGIKTRRALVEHALNELLRRERQKKVLDLKGTVTWSGNLDEMRASR